MARKKQPPTHAERAKPGHSADPFADLAEASKRLDAMFAAVTEPIDRLLGRLPSSGARAAQQPNDGRGAESTKIDPRKLEAARAAVAAVKAGGKVPTDRAVALKSERLGAKVARGTVANYRKAGLLDY